MELDWFIISIIYAIVGLGLYWAYFNYLKIKGINLRVKKSYDGE